MSDLQTIFNAIKAKQGRYNLLDSYYLGSQPTVYLTSRLREIFNGLDITFIENWCAVVVDACNERINLSGFESTDGGIKDLLAAAWDRNILANEASDIHTDAMVMGDCYAIAWQGEDKRAEVFYNDPRMVHVVYSAANPRKMAYAGKMFDGDDGKARLTLYYPDRLEYYTSSKAQKDLSTPNSFVADTAEGESGKAANPFGRVPVFHFKFNRHCNSDLVNVIPLQNGTNKLLVDMMVAAEFGAFNQRWVISQSDTSQLKNAPGQVWEIPAGDGQGQGAAVGQFESTDLTNYLDAIDRLSQAIGVISRTPKHYFFKQTGDPSGEALIAMEGPLNKKAQDRIDRFLPVWRDLAAFVCLIEGKTVDGRSITPVFTRPETIQPRTSAEITLVRTQSGTPLKTALRWEGKTPAEIQAMETDQEEQAAKSQTSLANALLDAEKRQKEKDLNPNLTPSPSPEGEGSKNGNGGVNG